MRTIVACFILLITSAMSEDSVYRHVVLFQFKKTATEEQVEATSAAFKALKKEIPQIQSFEWGLECSPEGLNQDISHCYLLTFKTKADFEIYLHHKKHKEFVENHVVPVIERPIVVDYVTAK